MLQHPRKSCLKLSVRAANEEEIKVGKEPTKDVGYCVHCCNQVACLFPGTRLCKSL